MSSYAWGLGRKTNNEVEWFALFFGLELANKLKITKIIFLGDSKQVIHKMINGYNKGAIKIRRIYERILQVSVNAQISYYHILRGNNSDANKMANQGAKLKMGISKVKGNLRNINYVPWENLQG